ncbi:hypothetical protein B8043_10810 [Klebsiella aerogenes]|nr:hypothetical protein B8043_10810 [Klebsiella aerogenes]
MLAISKSPVALPLTGATAQCDLVALLSAAQAGDYKQRHQCPIKLTCAATIRQPQANRTQVCC